MKSPVIVMFSSPARAERLAADRIDGLGKLCRVAFTGAFLQQRGEQRRNPVLLCRIRDGAPTQNSRDGDERHIVLLHQQATRRHFPASIRS